MDEETSQEMACKRIVYSLSDMEDMPVRRDIVFKTVGELALKMDVYAPIDQTLGSARSVVIFVSGGDASEDTLRNFENFRLWSTCVLLPAIFRLCSWPERHWTDLF